MLQFDNEAARKLETIYSSPDVVAQRSATLERLRLRPGEEVIDVGCGPGFLCEQMADCVGPTGRLPRSEPLPATLGLANAASQERILYTSTDGVEGKSLIAVSGALFIPKGTPPQEGWPLLAWAHGTEEPRHPPIARKPADRHNDQAESKSTSTTLDDSVAALDISSG